MPAISKAGVAWEQSMRVAYSPTGAPVTGQAAEGELDVSAVSRALWRHKWRILVPTLAVAAATFAFVKTLTPRYASEARVLVDVRENVFLRPDAEKNPPDRAVFDDQAVESQVQVFLSRDLARDIVAQLKLDRLPEFDPLLRGVSPITSILALLGLAKDPMKMSPGERVLHSYFSRLSVHSVERSRVIAVNFQSADPDLAAKVANAIAEGYLRLQREAKQDQARSASEWLAGEIEKLRKRVADAEDKVAAYRAKSSLFVGPNNTSLANQQLTELNTQLVAARARKADAQARAQSIRDILKSGRAIEASDVMDSELIRRLNEQRGTLMAQLAEQSSTLLGLHPRIKELKAQIADLEAQIRQEAVRRVRALENDAHIAGARVETLSASLDQLKGQAASSNQDDVTLRALEREAKAQRDLLESYLAKYREATARDSINAAPADARIISRATVSNVPVFPKRVSMVVVATMLSLMLGVGFTATRELLSPQNFRPIGAGFGALPRGRASSPSEIGVLGSAVPAALPVPLDGIEALARDLREVGDAGRRVAVFTASDAPAPSPGALALARSLAHDARVVLIELARNGPSPSTASGDSNAPGVAELVSGKAAAGEVITSDRLSSAHLIGAGQADDLGSIVNSPRFALAVEALGQSYDHVIINAGLLDASTAQRIAVLAPTAVLTASDPSDAAAEATREQLHGAGFADVALVLDDGLGSTVL